MINICFVMYDLTVVGGVGRVVESLANRLSENCSVHVISLHGEVLNPAFHFSDKIAIEQFNLPEKRVRYQLISTFFKMKQYFRKNKIEIAFLEATYVGFIGSPLGLFTKTKVVFCDHGALLNQINDRGITMMRKVAAALCDHVVVLTQKTKDDYEKYFGVNVSKITNIYNWISDSHICSDIKYDLNSKIILTAGRFTEEKGFDLLLDVAERVLSVNPEWKWYIYGEGPLEKQIREDIIRKGLKESVILKGVASKMDMVYPKIALYVLPSYREGIPLVLLEAKAYKIPCVSFDILTGPNEIIEDRINGYLVKPYDTEEMANCINELIQKPELRLEMSENSYSNIEKFREEKVLCQWVNLINRLHDACLTV